MGYPTKVHIFLRSAPFDFFSSSRAGFPFWIPLSWVAIRRRSNFSLCNWEIDRRKLPFSFSSWVTDSFRLPFSVFNSLTDRRKSVFSDFSWLYLLPVSFVQPGNVLGFDSVVLRFPIQMLICYDWFWEWAKWVFDCWSERIGNLSSSIKKMWILVRLPRKSWVSPRTDSDIHEFEPKDEDRGLTYSFVQAHDC